MLPPAYVVRREGNSFTLFVCPHRGGGPGTPPGGVPGSGTPPQGGTQVRYPPGGVPGSGTPPGGYPGQVPPGGYPGQVPPRGGTQVRYPLPPRGVPGSGTPWGTRVRYPPGGVPRSGTPPGGYPGQVPPRGGTRVRYPPGGVPGSGTPPGGYPGRTTEGVLTTRRAVCLLRSRRRTFLFILDLSLLSCFDPSHISPQRDVAWISAQQYS